MKPKNIMLLGFVNKAVDYLDKHMDEEPDTRLAELKNIDLISLKDKLSDNLDASLGTMQSTMSTLLKAGNEAFDQFIEDNHNKDSVVEQFNKIFEGDDFDETKKKSQDELARLLSFYNLENDFDDEEVEPSQDDELINQIVKNVTSDDIKEIVPIEHNEVNDFEIDSIISEIVENENYADRNNVTQETKPLEEVKDNVNRVLDDIKQEDNTQNTVEETVEIVEEEPYVSSLIDELRKKMLEQDEEDRRKAQQQQAEIINDLQEEIQPNENVAKVEDIEEEVAEEETVEEEKPYVSTLIDELREKLNKEQEQKKEKEERNNEVYLKISQIYPNLSQGFIRSVYDLKESIASEYKIGSELIVLHRVLFDSIEDLRDFVEICLNHEYSINADENKMIVDVMKQFINTDGKILTNIYEVANQAFLLKGNYEGYNVILAKND